MTKVQDRSRTRRQRLLDAALEVFAEHGYSDSAIDEIARASFTSKGGLYFHFPSKQALFLALLDEAGAALLQRVEAAMANHSDPLDRGDAALREALRVFGGQRLLTKLLLVEALGAGKEFTIKLNDLHSAFATLIAECLDEAVARGQIPPLDTQVAAHAWYGAVNHVVLRWLMTGKPRRLEDTYPELRALLFFGVTGSNAVRRP
ncbi:MAG: TetR/AcrR family transcriptional regulator [Chloroflexia bacterium]|nr:TetR/AcrR family transcriptional regulator [Chloroflexia bacterium]